jgi:dTDP-4-dehydrorhamnose 3,5-epimerase
MKHAERAVLTAAEGALRGAARDGQSITADWQPIQPLIDGVEVREVKNVVRPSGGWLTEIWRRDWELDDLGIDQVFQSVLQPGQISGWHVHRVTTDRIFVNQGLIKIVLFDARKGSSTRGAVNVRCQGEQRPALVVVPPGVWHGVQNVDCRPSALLNLVDKAYSYEQPDHYRLPLDSPEIPYRFESLRAAEAEPRRATRRRRT